MADILSLLYGDDADALERAQAQARALRGEQMLGQLGQMMNDRSISPVAGGMVKSAQSGLDDMDQVPGQRLKLALGKAQQGLDTEKLAEMQDTAARRKEDYAATHNAQSARSVLARALAAKLGKSLPGAAVAPDATAAELEPAMGNLEKAYGIDENAALRRALMAQKLAAAGAGPAGNGMGLKPKDIEEQFKELSQAVSTTQGRGNLNRENQQRLNSAERLEALIKDKYGEIQNLTPQQVREAGTALASLISQGAMSEHQIEELTPVSMASKFASLKQKILNEPQGADAQKFLQNMLETAGREKSVVLRQIRGGQRQGLPRFAKLREAFPDRVNSVLRGAGLNPEDFDQNLLFTGKDEEPAAPKKRLKFNPTTGQLE